MTSDDARTRQLIADPATRSFRPGAFLPYLFVATIFFMGLFPIYAWATDDGSGDPLGMKFILGFGVFFTLFAIAVLWYVRTRVLRTMLWIGPDGIWDRRFMKRALAWDEIASARRVSYRVGKYRQEAIALETPALDQVSVAGPRLRAFNQSLAGMPDLPVQISGLAGDEDEIAALIDRYLPDAGLARPPEMPPSPDPNCQPREDRA